MGAGTIKREGPLFGAPQAYHLKELWKFHRNTTFDIFVGLVPTGKLSKTPADATTLRINNENLWKIPLSLSCNAHGVCRIDLVLIV